MLLRGVSTSLLALLSMFLTSCAEVNPLFKIPDICKGFATLPFTDLAAPDPNDPTYPKIGFEESGQIKVMHGFGHAKLESGKRMIRVEQSVAIPLYANQATVFLNGWRLSYLGENQNLRELGALITKITLDQRSKRLTWHAVGELRDNDFKEGYEFTYYYTVIAWNDVAFNLVVDHSDCSGDMGFPHNAFIALNNGRALNVGPAPSAVSSAGALSIVRSFGELPGAPSGKPIAVLPRGFGFFWPDHHLLQIAYNLDHSEIFAEKGKLYIRNSLGQTFEDTRAGVPAPLPNFASRVDAGFVSWDTFVILKDNDSQRSYVFAELVSKLGGNDVGIIQPSFSILPVDRPGTGALGGSPQRQEYAIENIPFAVAIPMLTGWELSRYSDDAEVKEIGIWIEEWTYTPGAAGGTLRYTLASTLGDNDYLPDYHARHRVTVLGMRPLAGTVLKSAAE